MQAIQFRTIAQDGVISIPEQYRTLTAGELEVIVLIKDDINARKEKFLASVKKHKYRLPDDYRFERESLHER